MSLHTAMLSGLRLTISDFALKEEKPSSEGFFVPEIENGQKTVILKTVFFGYFQLFAIISNYANPLIWRRGGDSNPRWDIIPNTLSRRAT